MDRHALIRAVRVVSLGVAFATLPVAGQETGARLSGLLLTAGSGSPVTGAAIALVDSLDAVSGETVSNGLGAFSLPIPPPGIYRVRVTRIGYRPWASDTLRVATSTSSRTLRLEVSVRPVPLPELLVTEQSQCPTTPEERSRAFALYESVLPILASSSSTTDLGALRMRMVRPITVWKRGMRRYERDTAIVVARESLNNESPEHLETYGYAEAVSASVTTFYAPDGRALASPGFLATHCLSTVEDEDQPGVGLAFEPKPGRAMVDVEGVLWVDTLTRAPRELVFQYTSLRPFLRRHLEPALRADIRSRIPEHMQHFVSFHGMELKESHFGGVLHFARIPENVAPDRWLIREWRIRSPTLLYRGDTGGGRKSVRPVAYPLTHSGKVLAILLPEENEGQ